MEKQRRSGCGQLATGRGGAIKPNGLAGTMQSEWERAASRPLFLVSRPKLPVAGRTHRRGRRGWARNQPARRRRVRPGQLRPPLQRPRSGLNLGHPAGHPGVGQKPSRRRFFPRPVCPSVSGCILTLFLNPMLPTPSPREKRVGRGPGRGVASPSRKALLSPALSSLGGRRGSQPRTVSRCTLRVPAL